MQFALALLVGKLHANPSPSAQERAALVKRMLGGRLRRKEDMNLKQYEINTPSNEIKSGSLRFFGDWFGRPYDNYHQIISIAATDNSLIMTFNDDERLYVFDPSDIQITKNEFCIKYSSKVRWEWFSYGMEKTQKNKYFIEYTRLINEIVGETNIDWYEKQFDIDKNEPAVRMY